MKLKVIIVLFLANLPALRGKNDTPVCKNPKADIVFILDKSSSMSKNNVQVMKQFVMDMVNKYTFGSEAILLSCISYSGNVVVHFQWSADKQEMINNIKYLTRTHTGASVTGEALYFTNKELFSNARKGVQKIIILMTDGNSNEHVYKVEKEAEKIKARGVLIYVLAVGIDITMWEIESIATDKSFISQSFKEFDNQFQFLLKESLCSTATNSSTTTTPTPVPSTTTTTTPVPSTTTTTTPVSTTTTTPVPSTTTTTTPVPETTTTTTPVPETTTTTTPVPSTTTTTPTPTPPTKEDCQKMAIGELSDKHIDDWHERDETCISTPNGMLYSGVENKTKSGRECMNWIDVGETILSENVKNDCNYPERNRNTAKNYCRNPDNKETGPWCFTSDPNVSWDECAIERCVTTTQVTDTTLTTTPVPDTTTTTTPVPDTTTTTTPVPDTTTTTTPVPDTTTTTTPVPDTTTTTTPVPDTTTTTTPVPDTTTTTSTPPFPVCKNPKADIVFILDKSSSMSTNNVDEMKQFLIDMVNKYTYGTEAILLSCISYSDNIKVHFRWCADKQKMVDYIKYLAVTQTVAAVTGEVLHFINKELFIDARKGVQKIIILMTDGNSNEHVYKAEEEAEKLKAEGALIYVLAIGINITMREIESIATDKSFISQSFKEFDNQFQFLLNESLCLTTNFTTTTTTTPVPDTTTTTTPVPDTTTTTTPVPDTTTTTTPVPDTTTTTPVPDTTTTTTPVPDTTTTKTPVHNTTSTTPFPTPTPRPLPTMEDCQWYAIGELNQEHIANWTERDETCISTPNGMQYSGKISKTESGVECRHWIDMSTKILTMEMLNDCNYPERDRRLAKNYCRNPDNRESGPWCFSTDLKIIHETCKIERCSDIKVIMKH